MNQYFRPIIISGALLLLCMCARQQDAPLTPEEEIQIKREVKAAAEPLMTGWAALDGSIAIQSFSTEMVSCYDSLLLDYQSFSDSWKLYTDARESITITPINEEFIILSKDLAIDTWVGKVEETMKTGEKVTYNPIRYTNLFKKSDGQWKIIFAQSSGIPILEIPE